ncbi:hypothetical protein N7526_011230 [Penicillium atrosanguineum]|nr:hypothetical protein N7526_011230 [Penicillium atrosanguineum]
MAPMPSKSDSLQIINAGLFRTATKSMALAYQILGFKTHHGLLEKNKPRRQPGRTRQVPDLRKPYTRGDWSALWGGYDAVTDLASPFALELIKAYPEAKVVIVQRDFDSWWPSFKAEILDRVMLQPMATINGFLGLHLMGIPAVQAMRKIHFGFFGAQSRAEILNNAKDVYEEYYADVRAAVPAEQRLEYRVGDGWEPLCEFLKVDIPDVPFPRENDAGEHDGEAKARTRLIWANGLKVMVPILVLGLAVRIAFKRS